MGLGPGLYTTADAEILLEKHNVKETFPEDSITFSILNHGALFYLRFLSRQPIQLQKNVGNSY